MRIPENVTSRGNIAALSLCSEKGMPMSCNASQSLSIVVPVYNEEDNIHPLVTRVHQALAEYAHPWELIIVDDGSSDATWSRLVEAREQFGDHVRAFELNRNFGQTAAMQAGLDHVRGALVITMDGDLQNDPQDIPMLLEELLKRDLDMVSGWRKNRQDKTLTRLLPSFVANRIIGRVTGIRLRDYGCSLKAYRADAIKRLSLYGDMHRFIPAWVAVTTRASRIAEVPVRHHPRIAGKSKYNLSRVAAVVVDLISVFFFLRYESRPGHFFGGIGLTLGGVGSAIFGYLGFIKLFLGEDIGNRPLLTLGMILIIAAVQLLTVGVLAELMTRTYFEAGKQKSYVVRNAPESERDGWHSGHIQD